MAVETIALLGGALSLVTVCINLIVTLVTMGRVQAVHLATNSMKDALVEATRLSSLALGRTLGIAEERERRQRQDDQM